MEQIREFFKRFKGLKRFVRRMRKLREDAQKRCRMRKVRRDPLQANIELYIRNHGRAPDLDEPSNFNEKVMWLLHNVYADDPTVTRCADKYEMRGYVQEKGLGELLPEIYGVWDRPRQIPWDELPEQFVVKCNHGCGCNVICTDKRELDVKKANQDLRRWLKINFADYYGEINYTNIRPRIFCEQYLNDGTGSQPIDWKVMCFHGEPKMYMVCTERETGTPKFMFTDIHYDRLPVEVGHHAGGTLPPKPATLDRMTEYARRLSADFPFVRVDFYSIGEKIYLGEMTFSPLGCAIDYINDEMLQTMGDWLDLSEYRKG